MPPDSTALSPEPRDRLCLAGRTFHSRLLVGTGKYRAYDLMRDALDASGCEVVTVAVRRERLFNEQGKSLLEFIDTKRYTILPNTAGCFSAEDAVRVARLGRDILEQIGNPGASWVKIWETGPSPGVQDSPPAGLGWTFIQHDLTQYKNAQMRIRFGFDINAGGVFTIGSWTIDDVLVAEQACP